jgi:dipeptidyl aminopeptidase/acylaminoacyl peptidase
MTTELTAGCRDCNRVTSTEVVYDGHLTWMEEPDWDVEEVTVSADGRLAAWFVNVNGASRLRARDLVSGEVLSTADLPTGRARYATVSADARHVAFLISTPDVPWSIATVELGTGGGFQWVDAAQPAAAATQAFVSPQLVQIEAQDGRQVPAYLYRPKTAAAPVGVVISIHGGPVHQERPIYDAMYQYLVSRGVAVLAPNIRGSSGFGRTYKDLILGHTVTLSPAA